MQVHHDYPELSHFVAFTPTLRHEATDLERRRHAENSYPLATTEINLTTHERTRTDQQTHASQTSGHVKNGHDRNLVTHVDINTIKSKCVETHPIINQHTNGEQTHKAPTNKATDEEPWNTRNHPKPRSQPPTEDLWNTHNEDTF